MTELARAEVVIGGDNAPFMRAIDATEARMKAAGKRLGSIGRRLSTRVTLPLAAVGAASTKAFADFDSAMTQSLAIMGDVSDAMRNRMAEAARDVGRSTTIGSTQAAESFFFLASAGLDAEQSIAALPQVAAFAQAGMFDMATATDLATDAQSALGLTVDDAQQNLMNLTRVTDTLVRANTLANATVQQFSESLTNRAAAALRSTNKEVEEGVAVLAAYADQGLKGQRAGMFLSRTLRVLRTNAAENTEEFRRLGLVDAEGNLSNLADIVEVLTRELSGMSDVQKAARLEALGFEARIQDAILPLLGTADAIRMYERELRAASGTTQEVAEKQLQSFAAQMKIIRNVVVIAAQDLGATLAPMVMRVAKVVKNLALRFSALSPEVKLMAVTVAGLAAAIGPALTLLGFMVTQIGALFGVIGSVVGALASMGAAVAGFVSSIGLIPLAIGAVLVAFVAWADGWDEIAGVARSSINFMVGLLRFVGTSAVIVWEEFLRDPFIEVMKTIRSWAERIFGGVATILEKLGNLGSAAADKIRSAFRDAADQGEQEGRDLGSRLAQAALDSFGQDYVGQFVQLTLSGIGLAKEKIDEAMAELRRLMSAPAPEQGEEEGAGGEGQQFGFPGLNKQITVATESMRTAGSTFSDAFSKISEDGEAVADTLGRGFGGFFDSLFDSTRDSMKAFTQMAKSIVADLVKMIAKALVFVALTSFIPGFGAGGGALSRILNIASRQRGGPVFGGAPFLVGERGPEVFVPSGAGRIMSNEEMAGGPSASAVAGEILRQVGPPPGNAPPSTIETDNWWREVYKRLSRDRSERGRTG